MHYITSYFSELKFLVFEMSPWLLFGFLIAGILHVFFPDGKISRVLGKSNLKSVVRAALIGVPLPLCSCGVIPTGISIHRNGASKGAAISFLISTPQTGVDSIMVTYSMLGLPFAIIRPIIAFITGITGGIITNKLQPENTTTPANTSETKVSKNKSHWFFSIFTYAFVDFLEDIAKWLVIGLLLAALIAVVVPDDFFANYIPNDFVGMLIILAISIPLYVCATSSVPLAAVLLMKGLSPGSAFVFLMAGPATNVATITVIGNAMGRKTLFIYLGTLICGSLFFGLLIDNLLPRELFRLPLHALHGHHNHDMLPQWIQWLSGITITGLLINIFVKKQMRTYMTKQDFKVTPVFSENEIRVIVKGMNCSHCKTNVENSLSKIEGISVSDANVETETVLITGNQIDLDKVKIAVESIGYKYLGKV